MLTGLKKHLSKFIKNSRKNSHHHAEAAPGNDKVPPHNAPQENAAPNILDHAINTKNPEIVQKATKLHLGCGANIIPGWLNSDLVTTDSVPPETWDKISQIFIMDATATFTFDDNQFEYINCEDFLEHFDQKDGLSICAECFRVLKPGGVLRISTPGFDTILKSLELQKRETIAFGHWGWGHKLLYTENYCTQVLNACGFEPVKRCQFGESDYQALQNIDSREEQKDLNLILDAVKPL